MFELIELNALLKDLQSAWIDVDGRRYTDQAWLLPKLERIKTLIVAQEADYHRLRSDYTAKQVELRAKLALIEERDAQLRMLRQQLDAAADSTSTRVENDITAAQLEVRLQRAHERIDDLRKANTALFNDPSKACETKSQLAQQLAQCQREKAILAKSLADANANTAFWREKHGSAQREPASDACKQLVAGLRQVLADLERSL